jgi:hypothetical protein
LIPEGPTCTRYVDWTLTHPTDRTWLAEYGVDEDDRGVGARSPALLELEEQQHVVEAHDVVREFDLRASGRLELGARERELSEKEAGVRLGQFLFKRRAAHGEGPSWDGA